MLKIRELLKGKKSYIFAIAIGLCAAAQSLGYDIPEYVYVAFAALTSMSLRAAIGKKE